MKITYRDTNVSAHVQALHFGDVEKFTFDSGDYTYDMTGEKVMKKQ